MKPSDGPGYMTGVNGTEYRLRELDRRLTSLEGQNVAVLVDRVARLSTQVSWMIAAFATLILTMLGGIIIFLVTQGGR